MGNKYTNSLSLFLLDVFLTALKYYFILNYSARSGMWEKKFDTWRIHH